MEQTLRSEIVGDDVPRYNVTKSPLVERSVLHTGS